MQKPYLNLITNLICGAKSLVLCRVCRQEERDLVCAVNGTA